MNLYKVVLEYDQSECVHLIQAASEQEAKQTAKKQLRSLYPWTGKITVKYAIELKKG